MLLAVIVAAGCGTSKRLADVQQQLGTIQQQLAELEAKSPSRDELAALAEDLRRHLQALGDSGAARDQRLEELAARVERAASALDGVGLELDDLAAEIEAAQEELAALRTATEETRRRLPAASGPSPVELPSDPQQLYDGAYAHFQRGRYQLAIHGFQRYLDLYPNTDLADNATYWIGECYYRQQELQQAINQFDAVITRFPNSDRIPSALLKKGYAYLELNQRDPGVAQLQEVIRTYPGSDEARLARQRLAELGIDAGP
ncbi:MAG: tol-pal system protein YbgF [Acidobacteria bacterium]|nr:MAG: tol-pal system protein YbgF [Acidobacteriota bacterium]